MQFDATTRELTISGWAASEKANVFTTNFIAKLGNTEIYRGRIERTQRPDVVQKNGRPDWLQSGFRVGIIVPKLTHGSQELFAKMRLGNGEEFSLQSLEKVKVISLPEKKPAPYFLAFFSLIIAILLPLSAFIFTPKIRWHHQRTVRPETVFGGTVVISFLLLVLAGWTGSSIALEFDESPIAQQNGIPWIGKPQSIRSDEWHVITPFAISQSAQTPTFPVLNTSLGIDGQNMLIVGMTGVPVAHLSALAKPATWGFFAFDLKRALAWYWWMPFFGCFGAVWLLLQRMFAINWRLAAGLALTLTCSPYSVVFSGWPAYAVFFPATALLAVNAALRTSSLMRATVAGVVLGLATAGFALLLYPAWQISLAYLFVPLLLAWLIGNRKALSFGTVQWVANALAVAVTVSIVMAWWLDAQDAIAAIRATVYPGQRTDEVGGDADRWFLIKGLISPVTMYRESGIFSGASDAGSVVLFLAASFACAALRWRSRRHVDALSAVIFSYILLVLCFMFIGFPADIARFTLWGSATSYRMDLGLGMAQVLVFAWLASPDRKSASSVITSATPTTTIVVAALAMLHAAFLYQILPPAILNLLPASHMLLLLAVTGLIGYLMAQGAYAMLIVVYGALTLASALPFNPLSIAPSNVKGDPQLMQAVKDLPQRSLDRQGIAVISDSGWSVKLTTIGLPVANGIFYYPPDSLWRSLDPRGDQRVLWNRYQHLHFSLDSLPAGVTYRLHSPRLDAVWVTLDTQFFNFRKLKCQAVLTTVSNSQALSRNPSLRLVSKTNDWALFEVEP